MTTLTRTDFLKFRCPKCCANVNEPCFYTGKGASKKIREKRSHLERMQLAQRNQQRELYYQENDVENEDLGMWDSVGSDGLL